MHRVAGDVSTGHGRVPVVGVQYIGRPGWVEFAGSQVGRYPPEQGKALEVVRPLAAFAILVRTSRAPIQIGGVNNIGHNTMVSEAPQTQCDAPRTKHGAQLT